MSYSLGPPRPIFGVEAGSRPCLVCIWIALWVAWSPFLRRQKNRTAARQKMRRMAAPVRMTMRAVSDTPSTVLESVSRVFSVPESCVLLTNPAELTQPSVLPLVAHTTSDGPVAKVGEAVFGNSLFLIAVFNSSIS